MPTTNGDANATIARLSAARWRIAIALTFAMMFVYFGFILLVAFDKPLLGTTIVPGMSIGILLGVIVIVTSWVGLVTIPLSFIVGVIVSILTPEPAAEAKFHALEHRLHLGEGESTV